MKKDERDISIRRRALAEDILRFRNKYPLAKLVAFYAWASEEDQRGRMRREREKSWSTGGRLLLFTTKATLPDGWQEIFPEFAAAWEPEAVLFDETQPGKPAGALQSRVPSQPDKPDGALQGAGGLSEDARRRFGGFIAAVKGVQRPQQQLAYFDVVQLASCTPEVVTFAVPSRWVMEYIEKHLVGVMEAPFRQAFGKARLQWKITYN